MLYGMHRMQVTCGGDICDAICYIIQSKCELPDAAYSATLQYTQCAAYTAHSSHSYRTVQRLAGTMQSSIMCVVDLSRDVSS